MKQKNLGGLLAVLTLTLSINSALAVNAAVDPSSLLVNVYAMAVSASTDCSNPIQVFKNDSATEVDFLANPTLGQGTVPDGTYKCVMITMSDNLKFKPSAASGTQCVTDTTYTIDVCRSDQGSGSTYDSLDGTTFGSATACSGTDATPTSDKVTLYLTTTSPVSGDEAFHKPTSATDTTHGLNLASAWVVSGTSSGKFVVDGRGQVQDIGSKCEMGAPAFSFK